MTIGQCIGIGLNESPWTNQTVTPTLSSEWKDYRYLLTSNFGDNNSRVLFDMGAATGQIQLDNVSLFESLITMELLKIIQLYGLEMLETLLIMEVI